MVKIRTLSLSKLTPTKFAHCEICLGMVCKNTQLRINDIERFFSQIFCICCGRNFIVHRGLGKNYQQDGPSAHPGSATATRPTQPTNVAPNNARRSTQHNCITQCPSQNDPNHANHLGKCLHNFDNIYGSMFDTHVWLIQLQTYICLHTLVYASWPGNHRGYLLV